MARMVNISGRKSKLLLLAGTMHTTGGKCKIFFQGRCERSQCRRSEKIFFRAEVERVYGRKSKTSFVAEMTHISRRKRIKSASKTAA